MSAPGGPGIVPQPGRAPEQAPRRGRAAAVTAVVLGLLLAFLAGAAGAWWWQSRTVDELTGRLDAAEQQLSDVVAETPVPGATTGAEPGAGTSAGDAGGAGETGGAASGEVGAAVAETQSALLRSMRSVGGTPHLTVDYVLFLTGQEASDAAAAHGDESPPPNDYYVVNDNPRLREFPLADDATVHVAVNPDGTSAPDGRAMPLADWLAAMSASSTDPGGVTSGVFWLTITDGVITELWQQFVP